VRSGEFVARYFAGGVHRASAGVARDRDILRDERAFELMAGASCGSERPQVRRGRKCIGLVGER
jgi:hypothetical protein